MSLEYRYTFQDGENAGDLLLALICEIQPEKKEACYEFVDPDRLAPVFAQLWQESQYKRPLRCIEGFLSRTLKPSGLNTQLLELWGVDELLENQQRVAPACNLPPECGIVQLGSWTGESDGDGWCLDIDDRSIRCVDVGCSFDNVTGVRALSYGVFYSLWHWIAHLRCSAWERGWVKRM